MKNIQNQPTLFGDIPMPSVGRSVEPEIWKTVPAHPEYSVSSRGRVFSSRLGGMMKQEPLFNGYLRIGLNKDGKQYRYRVHVLVAELFLGSKPAGYEINHKNGNKRDNRVCNLEYVTRSENQQHSHNILSPRRRPLLNKFQIRIISYLLKQKDLTQKTIAELFQVPELTIQGINTGRNYARFIK